jgi:hypothetical protein
MTDVENSHTGTVLGIVGCFEGTYETLDLCKLLKRRGAGVRPVRSRGQNLHESGRPALT